MKRILTIFFLSLSIVLHAQEKEYSENGFYIPKNIEECNLQLDIILGEQPKDLIQFTEDKLLRRISGMMILGDWCENDSTRLYRYFKTKGITDYEDRDYLILFAYKKHLLKKPFNIDKEASLIKVYNDSIEKTKQDKYNRDILADSINGVYIPIDLNDSMRELDRILDDSTKLIIRENQDNMSTYHFGLGSWLRNNWRLWGGSRLQQWFDKEGIFHPDNISGIILSVYQEYLKNGQIDTKKRLVEIKEEQQKFMLEMESKAIEPIKINKEDFYSDEYKEFIKTRKIEELYIVR